MYKRQGIRSEGMGGLPPHPAAPRIHLRIREVDAVAGIRHLVALLRGLLDGYAAAHIVQARATTETAAVCRQRTAHACGGVHPASCLGHIKICAVEHLPFHTIPQSVQRIDVYKRQSQESAYSSST